MRQPSGLAFEYANLGNRFRATRAALRLHTQIWGTVFAALEQSRVGTCKFRAPFSRRSCGRALEHAILGNRFRAIRAVPSLNMQISGTVFAPFERSRVGTCKSREPFSRHLSGCAFENAKFKNGFHATRAAMRLNMQISGTVFASLERSCNVQTSGTVFALLERSCV